MAPSDRHTSEKNAKPSTLRNVTPRTRAIVVVRERGASTRRFYADDYGVLGQPGIDHNRNSEARRRVFDRDP